MNKQKFNVKLKKLPFSIVRSDARNEYALPVTNTVKGIGPKTATAVVAAIGKGTEFKNGRHFAAWLGLVPRQHSSGDRQVLMNMTKKGDKHLRTLFIHGARAVVRVATNNNDGHMNQWVNQLKERRGFNKTTVAVDNKNARIIWSMLRNETEYQVV
ncbi:rmpB [Klebsiella quasipneumoniae]|nr:rmpB [Klebsiella quasipneumoniae]